MIFLFFAIYQAFGGIKGQRKNLRDSGQRKNLRDS